MTNSEGKLICLMGPTATGKSALSLAIARALPVEIISVDSAMVYRGMDIGTAKPEREILEQVPHHLINICEPFETYSAGKFWEDIQKIIPEILKRKRVPLLVGGTMLYFKTLQQGFSNLPSADKNIREQINQEIKTLGLSALHQKLMTMDPAAAAKINPNDPARIARALEIFYLTGKPKSEWQATNKKLPYDFLNLALTVPDRAILSDRIALRLQKMFDAGFIDEVKALRENPLMHPDLSSMRSLGYRQVWDFLEGAESESVMKQKVFFATRQFAKRQFTWLNHWALPLHWLDVTQKDLEKTTLKSIESFLFPNRS